MAHAFLCYNLPACGRDDLPQALSIPFRTPTPSTFRFKSMDMTQLAQMVNWLDEQHRRDRAEIARLQQRLESQTNELQEQARRVKELEQRLTSTQTQIGRFDQVDQALQNLRTELTIMVNNQAEELAKTQREGERARMTDREGLTRGVAEVRKELGRLRPLEEEIGVRKAEDQRLNEVVINLRQEVADLNKDIDERTRSLPYLSEQRNHDNKRIAQLQQENVEIFKRVEEMAGKTQMLEQKQQKTASQAQGFAVAAEEMKQGQKQFVESLKLADADRQRQMREWQEIFTAQSAQFDEFPQRLKEFAAKYEAADRALASLEQFQTRLQREQNQVAELQRLAEERQRREVANFQAEIEKRWKKQTLEWDFQWEQQAKVNATVKDRFPAIALQLEHHTALLEFLWRAAEAEGGAQLRAAQQWLGELQKLAEQRQKLLKAYEERTYQQP